MTLPRILIITPFRNEAHSFPKYFKALNNLDYPPGLIDVFWLENDSSDNTVELLEAAKDKTKFNSIHLRSIKIHGPIPKGVIGEYRKQVPQKRGRVAKAWMLMWNVHFLPFMKTRTHDYVLVWFADALAPPNVIHEYLKVYADYEDAGWVGGKCHRRFPIHDQLCSPNPRELPLPTVVTPVLITAHIWLSPREALANAKMYRIPREMFLSVISNLHKQELRAYYQPSVLLKHVSSDGKVYPPDYKVEKTS